MSGTLRLAPLALGLLLLVSSGEASAQEHHLHATGGHAAAGATGNYAALPPQEVQALRAGAGMELARVADVHRYPGPRHVLELAAPLALSPAQRRATEAIQTAMRTRAVALGQAILEAEAALEAAFADGTINQATLTRMTARIAELRGALRAAHLAAHLEMQALLTPAQVDTYAGLRGGPDRGR